MTTILNELNKIAFLVAPIFYKLLFMSIAALCVGSVIMLIRRFADRKISPHWKYIMWILVLVALVVPYRPQSKLALLDNVQRVEEISFRDEYDQIKMEQHNFFGVEKPTIEQQVEFKEIERNVRTVYLKSLIFDVAVPLLWFFGLIIIAIFMGISFLRLSLMLRRHQYEINEKYYLLLEKCKATLGIKTKVKIILQDYIGSPALSGIVHPKIILPLFAEEISEENIEYIMLHELSHYKRFDMQLNYLLLLLQMVYWFNPLVWILFKFIRQDMELSNDTYVLNHIGKEKAKKYSQSLVEVLGQYNKVSFGPRLLCMVDGKDNIERRIKMIKLGGVFKKHRFIIAAVSIVIIGIISGLFLTRPVSNINNNMNSYKTHNPDDYISITMGYMTTYDEANDYAEYGASVYEYNLQSEEISEIFSFPYNTQYPLGVYDKKTNSVYYTKEKNNNSYKNQRTGGDQIYVHNLQTGSDTMLTEDLLAVNHIVPDDGNLFFIAARERNLLLGKIDLSDGSIKYWDEADTAATRTISVDKINKRIYVAIYDTEEEDIAITRDIAEHATPEYTIYSFDYNLSDKQEVLHKANGVIKALYAMDNQLLYRVDDTISPLPDTTTISEVIDLNNMKVLFKSGEQFPERGSFARDMKGVYTLGSKGGDKGIYYHDFETRGYTPILEGDIGSVANFQLMYQD